MSLVSMQFFTFIVVALIGYYLIPKRFQWIWLLLFSYVYYISYGVKYVFFILYTTCVTYFSALLIYCIGKKIDDNNKKSIEHKKKNGHNNSFTFGIWSISCFEIHKFCYRKY